MVWVPLTTFTTASLLALTVFAWRSSAPRLNLLALGALVLALTAVAPELLVGVGVLLWTTGLAAVSGLRVNDLVMNHADMLVTGGAVVWLVRRAWQTLWKPVPELISILGVDVPEPPDVTLVDIKAEAASINWTRHTANRPVQKFLVQVNGVSVGDVPAHQEPAITITGLKPNHFYNVRVIAVGSNNFQAGSRVIRLRTLGKDGRPQLGNARLPSNFILEDQRTAQQGEHGDENGGPRSPVPSLETTAAGDGSSGAPGTRRNTVSRRHSPSTASQHPYEVREEMGQQEADWQELNARFEGMRQEITETQSLISKEEDECKKAVEELEAEKQEKKAEQKKKESQTDKLRREQGSTERQMRTTQQKKVQLEKKVKEKQAERTKMQDNISKWTRHIDEMREDQDKFETQKKELEEQRDDKISELRGDCDNIRDDNLRMESELKDKKAQVAELEDARKTLPGGEDDAEWREKDLEMRREWQSRNREFQERFNAEVELGRRLENSKYVLKQQLQHVPQAQAQAQHQALNNPLYNHGNSSGYEFDAASQQRRNRNSASISNVNAPSPRPGFTVPEVSVTAATGFAHARGVSNSGFAPGPFMGLTSLPPRLDEDGIRSLDAPLSPSAAALLPSNILDDDDSPSPSQLTGPTPFAPAPVELPEEDPQSPASSSRSMSIFNSPHGSNQNLPFPPLASDTSDRRSLNAGSMTSPVSPPGHSSSHRFGSLFSGFQRSRGAKDIDEVGPALGTLKAGQSQSFPRHTDDPESLANKRRISISTMFNRNSTGPELLDGRGASAIRNFSARNFNPFSGVRNANGLVSERDPSSPRPASIASSDLPRPSTESGGIWHPLPGDMVGVARPRGYWPTETSWSRNPSRRPSLHNGSGPALQTTLASADDEILDDDDLNPPSQVGVIGSRPTKQSLTARLNPTAPAFMTNFFRPKTDKDKEKTKDKLRSKDKDRDDQSSRPDTPATNAGMDDSPVNSRQSRDSFSVHTQTSVSESRESLSLDQPISNTPSEPVGGAPSSFKDEENVVRRLFRKGSSSKFTLAGRLSGKDGSSLFKKGPSSVASAANSDKNFSAERSSFGDLDELAGEDGGNLGLAPMRTGHDSVTSSPGIGPSANGKFGKDGKASGTASRWFSIKKAKKEKESLELDRSRDTDGETPGEEAVKTLGSSV